MWRQIYVMFALEYSICCHGSILVTIELFVQLLYKHKIYEYDDLREVRSTEQVDTRKGAQTVWIRGTKRWGNGQDEVHSTEREAKYR